MLDLEEAIRVHELLSYQCVPYVQRLAKGSAPTVAQIAIRKHVHVKKSRVMKRFAALRSLLPD